MKNKKLFAITFALLAAVFYAINMPFSKLLLNVVPETIMAALLWGFENNCTRKISEKNVYEIVMLKGIFSGIGSLIIGLIIGERLPEMTYILIVLVLGYVAYGLSIFFYIKAQKELGAAKTSAYYAVAPFIGALLSFIILREHISVQFFIALIFMAIGSMIATIDTMILQHKHMLNEEIDIKID